MNAKVMGRVTALMGSVMDLHVRIALQEVDKEKRRLIGGGVFLGAGLDPADLGHGGGGTGPAAVAEAEV